MIGPTQIQILKI